MNDAVRRDFFGFLAKQTKATQDFRQGIYLYPDGKIGHWVRNPYSPEPYWVADLTGGSTFEPGSTVMLASFSGRRGEGIVGRSPAGFGGAAISEATIPHSSAPAGDPEIPDLTTYGYYLGWSYYCDGGGYVWTATMHHRIRYTTGPTFLDGTVAIRVARLSMAELAGGADMPIDGYEIGEFLSGTGGTEAFRTAAEPMVSEIGFRTVSIIASGGYVFVVTVPFEGTAYTVHLMTDSGTALASDSFSGRAWPSSPDALGMHSSICSYLDGSFYFAHPIGAGAQEFRFCRRSVADASIQSYLDIDFSLDSSIYAGMTAIPGAPGVRIFRNADDSSSQEYRDFDGDFAPLSAWVSMDFGPDNQFGLVRANMIAARSGGFAVLGVNASTDAGVFLLDLSGDFASELGDHAPARPSIYPSLSGSYVFIGTGVVGEFALYRMLSDGTIA